MKDNYNPFTRRHWIATVVCDSLAMTEVKAHNRHCERRKTRGNPVPTGEWENAKAFSLIELLISLIIISLMISAFLPVLTKKLKNREIAYSAAKQMKIDCSKFDSRDGSCLLCDERVCNLCTSSINITDGYFVNPNQSCNKQSCAKFDAQCRRCTKDGCQECNSGYELKYGRCQKEIVLQTPSSQADCPGAYYYQGMCITLKNAGDGGASINKTNVIVNAPGTKCTGGYCCWTGGKNVPHCKQKTGSNYDPCSRTVCQIGAAKIICNNYSTSYAPKWELPTSSEVELIKKADKTIRGIGGLQLCISTDTSGIDYCSVIDGERIGKYCRGLALGGQNDHKCSPSALAEASDTSIRAFSVRCITRQVYK